VSIHIPDEQELFEEENEEMFRAAREGSRKILAAKGLYQPATAEPTPSTEQDATLLKAMENHPGLTYEKAEEMAKAFGF
jgi:hypothetical protein